MSMEFTKENIAETVAKIVEERADADLIALGNEGKNPTFIAHHKNQTLVNVTEEIDRALDKFQPARRSGTDHLHEIDSLIEWTNRFKGSNSVLFCDAEQPSLTCITNYHGEGAATPEGRDPLANHCDHRGVYKFPHSEEWKAWSDFSGKWKSPGEFGEFIEDRSADFYDPTPYLANGTGDAAEWEKKLADVAARLSGRFATYRRLLELSRGLEIHESQTAKFKRNPDTGEGQIFFEATQAGQDGGKIDIPNLALIAIPVFENGAAYTLPVRLAYRPNGGDVKFRLTLHDADKARRDAIREGAEKAKEATALPLFYGTN
jgi:hypothetical protein